MDQPTFNERMVAKLQAILLESADAQSVTVDGQSVAYADLVEQLAAFEQRTKGTKRRVSNIHLEASDDGLLPDAVPSCS